MTISMENYYFSSGAGQDKTMTISMENYYFRLGTGQDKTEWQSVWSALSVLALDEIKLNDNQYGELLLQFWHCTR